jgi:hypothetical protein
MGLGQSVRTGVTEVLKRHATVVTFEDDLICVPGTYAYLCAALSAYAEFSGVMSITAWTHPSVIPADVTDQFYFDGRAESLTWATWRRAWEGMQFDAKRHLRECRRRGIDVNRYGKDVPAMAEDEKKQNIWAVRWLSLHLLRGGLCLRPPHSLVEHIGFDKRATNAQVADQWANPPLKAAPPLPSTWPPAVENPACPELWQGAMAQHMQPRSTLWRKVQNAIGRLGK